MRVGRRTAEIPNKQKQNTNVDSDNFVIFFYLTDVQVVAGYHADDMPSTGKLLQIVDQAIIIVAPDNLDLAIAY